MSKLDEFMRHASWCNGTETYPCDCGFAEAFPELDALKLVVLIAADVNKWLIESGRGGTAHQLQLSAALKRAEQ